MQNLTAGMMVEEEFVVREKHVRELRSGQGTYLSLVLVTSTGQTIEARAWENAEKLNEVCECGDVVLAKGQTSEYRGQMQLKVISLTKCPAADISKFVPSLECQQREELAGELRSFIESVCEPHLRALLDHIFGDEETWNRFCCSTAARSLHSAYLGGLLEHTVNVLKLCQAVCAVYPHIHRDLLTTAAMLHDIGKIDAIELRGAAFEYSEEGKLMGEPVLSERRVSRAMQQIPDFPEQHRLLISHLLLSHHGELEFGAPILPACLEAVVLHLVDNLEAKANAVTGIMHKEKEAGKIWSEFNRSLGRSIYLPRLQEEEKSEIEE